MPNVGTVPGCSVDFVPNSCNSAAKQIIYSIWSLIGREIHCAPPESRDCCVVCLRISAGVTVCVLNG